MGIFAYIAGKGLLSVPLNAFSNREIFNLKIIGIKNYSLTAPSPIITTSIIILFLFAVIIRLRKNTTGLMSCFSGAFIGLIIGTAWLITGYIGADDFEPMNLDAFSFVYPVAETLNFAMYSSGSIITFTISTVLGVLAGAFALSRFRKSAIVNCIDFKDNSSIHKTIYGSSLMGIGGVMALGCSIGQGISGMSTLAFGSLVVIVSIFISAYWTGVYLKSKNQLSVCRTFD